MNAELLALYIRLEFSKIIPLFYNSLLRGSNSMDPKIKL